ncbi:MAG: hypothetical protein ABI443_09005 [Chthoniobacterales bacterium]
MEASPTIPGIPPHPRRLHPYKTRRALLPPVAAAVVAGEAPPMAPEALVAQGSSQIVRLVQIGIGVFFIYLISVAFQGNVSGAVAGGIVNACAMFPLLLWVMGKAHGFPIYPLYASMFVSAFGMQMIQNRELIQRTPPELFWISCLAISGFLLLSTALWFPFVRKPKLPPATVMAIGGKRSQPVLIAGQALSTIFIIEGAMGGLDWLGGFSTVLRAFMFCLSALSTFILAYDLGLNNLKPFMKWLYLFLVGMTMLAHGSGFLLVQAMGTGLLSMMGYIIASHKFPWKVFAIGCFIMSILHYGKYSMREKYWHDEYVGKIFSPFEYPAMYAEWSRYGLNYFFGAKKYDEERSTLVERSGLLHLFFKVQEMDDHMPLLQGKTYAILPMLLIPHFLNKNRLGVHETTTLLNIYFNIQSREDSENTTVGWGLFNEAYANFGYFGLGMLAVVLALFFGKVTQYSMGCPVTSFQGLVAISVMNVAYQSEFSSGVFVTVLFQTLVALVGLRFLIMQPITLDRTKLRTTMGGI